MDTRFVQEQLEKNKQVTDVELMLAQQENQDMRKLQQQTQELSGMMVDMHHLTREQGILISDIADNTELARRNTETGVETLEKVERKQNRKRWIIATLITLAGIGLGIWGGHAVGTALGLSGFVAAAAGFGIILGGVLALALVCFTIYSIVHACRRPPAEPDDYTQVLSTRRNYTPVERSERAKEFSRNYVPGSIAAKAALEKAKIVPPESQEPQFRPE